MLCRLCDESDHEMFFEKVMSKLYRAKKSFKKGPRMAATVSDWKTIRSQIQWTVTDRYRNMERIMDPIWHSVATLGDCTLLQGHSVSNHPKFLKLETRPSQNFPKNYHMYWNMSLAYMQNFSLLPCILAECWDNELLVGVVSTRDVTESESASESDGIRQFFRNPKSNGYLKSELDGLKILVSVQLTCYFRK